MKIVICTTPIRETPTPYPPFGSVAIVQSLRLAGYDPYFYDIDAHRYDVAQVEAFFSEHQPDVIGISAVVSTAYAYTKQLTRMLRRVAPNARIVVGGNLAASAEILHRLADVDICVIGEGEVIAVNLMRALEKCRGIPLDYDALSQVRGITYVQPDGEMNFTGYEAPLPADMVFEPNWDILEQYSRIEHFIRSPLTRPDFYQDKRSYEPHRKGKMMGVVVATKGCVARCTFCHRWDKGFRAIPVSTIIARIEEMIRRYNVGFVSFSDENFGSDRRQARELLAQLKPLDILWHVSGVRVKSVSPELLRDMRDAGCVGVYYGMETGSPTILEIMEKNATREDNFNAAHWTREAGLFTIFQMVLAMPGETEETIRETTEFLKEVCQDVYESPLSRLSINYIQALPGTPVYEYARHKGLIGNSLLDEEKYLLGISDTDAVDDTKTLNFTDYDYLTVRSWRRRIVFDVLHHYYQHNKIPVPNFFAFLLRVLTRGTRLRTKRVVRNAADRQQKVLEDYTKGGYFNLSRDLAYDAIVAYFYPLRHVILTAWLLHDEFRRLPLRRFLSHVREWLRHKFLNAQRTSVSAISLRKTMRLLAPQADTLTDRSMQPLREGR